MNWARLSEAEGQAARLHEQLESRASGFCQIYEALAPPTSAVARPSAGRPGAQTITLAPSSTSAAASSGLKRVGQHCGPAPAAWPREEPVVVRDVHQRPATSPSRPADICRRRWRQTFFIIRMAPDNHNKRHIATGRAGGGGDNGVGIMRKQARLLPKLARAHQTELEVGIERRATIA